MLSIRDRDIYRRSTPHVTYALIAINLVVAAVMYLYMSDLQRFTTIYRYGAVPSELTGGAQLGIERIIWNGRAITVDLTSHIPTVMTIFTSMFLHGGWVHVGGNMLFLWVFGVSVEDRMGHVGYLLFYLLAGVIAAFTQVAVDPTSQAPMIGASGAIAGILGAYLVLYPRSRIDIFNVRVPAAPLLGAWILIQVFVGTANLGTEAASGVAYFAHIGGFAFGAAGIWALERVGLV